MRCLALRGAESIPYLSTMLYVNFHAFLRIPCFILSFEPVVRGGWASNIAFCTSARNIAPKGTTKEEEEKY